MNIWQLQEAKAKFSQLVKFCKKEPQIVPVRGQNEAILISIQDYNKIIGKKESFLDLMSNSPLKNVKVNFLRDTSKNRDIDL